MKRIAIWGLLLFFVFFVRQQVYAADLTITCGASSCTKSTNSPLFDASTIWYPGLSGTRTIQFVNTIGDTRSLSTAAVSAVQTGDIDTVMQFTMQQSGSSTTLWDNTLRTLYGSSAISLPNIPSNGTFDLNVIIAMHASAGNEFQEKATMFNLAFTISGVTEPVVVQTISDGGGGTTTTSTPGPTGIPLIQQVTQLFGGGSGGPAVAGAATEETPPSPPTPEKVSLGEVKGTTTCQTCIWWPFLLVETVALLFHYLLTRQKGGKLFRIGGIVINIVIYLAFLWVNGACRSGWHLWLSTSSFWCRYFIAWIVLIYTVLSFLFKPKKTE